VREQREAIFYLLRRSLRTVFFRVNASRTMKALSSKIYFYRNAIRARDKIFFVVKALSALSR
jgi:hypothetical protein